MKKIDGIIFKQMLISGSNNLFNCYPEIDSLNVFPVPDGDTGTNMNLTMSSGIKEIANKNDKSIANIAKSFSRGLLMGARGNSGVILSQIFRGFSQGLAGKEEVDAMELADAFVSGRNVAYKAVIRPVEGTILTVVREASDFLANHVKNNMSITDAMNIFFKEAEASLQRTPDLLPVLKEVGVVDSGGAGFCKVIEGFLKALNNEIVEKDMPEVLDVNPEEDVDEGSINKIEVKENAYSTEFILRLPKKLNGKREFNENRFKSVLNVHGKSIEESIEGDLVKVHIHTSFPGNILSFAQQYGDFVKIKIENINEVPHKDNVKEEVVEEKVEPQKEEPVVKTERKKYALISCCSGKGIEDMFKSQRVDYIVSGGQTMNPSTEDFVKACKEVNADVVYIFPNNSNIIMAASQASQVITSCKVIVIPSKTVPQGMVSSMMFNPEVSPEENQAEMEGVLDSVKTGQITFSIRDTSVDGIEVKKDEFMGILDKKIVLSMKDKMEATKQLITDMIDSLSSIITIFVGEDVTAEEEKEITDFVNEKYGEDIDVDIKRGDQPVYSFVIGVE